MHLFGLQTPTNFAGGLLNPPAAATLYARGKTISKGEGWVEMHNIYPVGL